MDASHVRHMPLRCCMRQCPGKHLDGSGHRRGRSF